jgi:hypothetical protein
MAVLDSKWKLSVYRALYRVNLGFARIQSNLDTLRIEQFFKDDKPHEDHPVGWQARLEEVQAAINRRLCENLHNLEHGDLKRLGRVMEMAPHIREALFGDELKPTRSKTRPLKS